MLAAKLQQLASARVLRPRAAPAACAVHGTQAYRGGPIRAGSGAPLQAAHGPPRPPPLHAADARKPAGPASRNGAGTAEAATLALPLPLG